MKTEFEQELSNPSLIITIQSNIKEAIEDKGIDSDFLKVYMKATYIKGLKKGRDLTLEESGLDEESKDITKKSIDKIREKTKQEVFDKLMQSSCDFNKCNVHHLVPEPCSFHKKILDLKKETLK